ncbi:MAG: phenylalanine--tRNA ligase subunit beta [Candidatus Binataceae bacterium]
MKLPLSWLREFVAIDADPVEIASRVTVAGLEFESVERLKPAFSGVTVGKVLTVQKHPNADRLSLCEVDIGTGVSHQVVCGAPNVRAGMTGAFAAVGAKLGDAPALQAATIRGVTSQGMLCSERELGLADQHGGIVELPDDAPLGADVAQYMGLDDTVFDVAIPPNRGDCASVFGIAREVAAVFGLKLKSPHLRPLITRSADPARAFSVDIAAPDLCPRYAGLVMSRIKIGRSPLWVRRRLELCGMRALNNVVDATNLVMLERGQPLHAFDLERIAKRRIIVRRAGADRQFVTLDNVTRELRPDDLLIADADKPLAIAGIMGGLNSEVSDTTTTILLESAYFEPITIARTARRLGLRSEASYRFERAIDRDGQISALVRVAWVIREIAGGREAGPVGDYEVRKAAPREISLDLKWMRSLLGAEISAPIATRRLNALGAKVSRAASGVLRVVPPSFRPDLNDPADLAEEVARVSGLLEIPSIAPTRSTAYLQPNREREFARATREVMLGCGLTEMTTIAFIAPADNLRFPGDDDAAAVVVENPLSMELSELRRSLVPGLVSALRFNLNREATAVHSFEIGKVFSRHGDVAREGQRIAMLSYGAYARAAVGENPLKAGFFTLKGVLDDYFETLGIGERVRFERLDHATRAFLHPGSAAAISLDSQPLGYIGELHPSEALRLELYDACALCELDLGKLISYGFSPRKTIEPPPRFPSVRRDLALVIDRDFPADGIVRAIRDIAPELLEAVEVFDVYVGGAIAAGKKSVALALRFRGKDRTLRDEEVNRAQALIVEQLGARLGAELRQ